MHSHEIPSSQWVPFFDDLTRRHQGEHVSVELLGRNPGTPAPAEDQSLVAIAVDPPTGACKIDVRSGHADSSNIAHDIAHPIHVRLTQSDDGKDTAVEIETCSGPCRLLRFLPASS